MVFFTGVVHLRPVMDSRLDILEHSGEYGYLHHPLRRRAS